MMKKCFIKILLTLILLVSAFGQGRQESNAAVIPPKDISRIVWFGDSRTVYFAKATYGCKPKKGVHPYLVIKKHVVARSSSTYSWAAGTGYRYLKKRLKKRPDSIVIFNFGVNDIGRGYNHTTSYLKLIKKIHKNFPKVLLCFMSVNPVKASSGNPYARTKSRAKTLNRKINAFNRYIRTHLPKKCVYINTNSKVAFSYKDGLHYTNKTYRRIAYYITGKKRF